MYFGEIVFAGTVNLPDNVKIVSVDGLGKEAIN